MERRSRVITRKLWMFLCAYSGFFSVDGVGGGPPISWPCIMPGPMDSMCFCIRSMWVTTVSHISTFVCQRAFSLASLCPPHWSSFEQGRTSSSPCRPSWPPFLAYASPSSVGDAQAAPGFHRRGQALVRAYSVPTSPSSEQISGRVTSS